jgi:hypothetical protein
MKAPEKADIPRTAALGEREEMGSVGRARREGLRQVHSIRIGEMCRFILEIKEELPASSLAELITEAFPNYSLNSRSLGNILTRTPGLRGRATRHGNLWSRSSMVPADLPQPTRARLFLVLLMEPPEGGVD